MTEDASVTGRVMRVPMPLRWGDLDAFGHVNNVAMLKLLEEARVRAFFVPEDGVAAPDTAVIEVGTSRSQLTLVARQEAEYLFPVPYQRHPLDIRMWFGKLGGSSADVYFEVYSPVETASEAQPQVLYAKAMVTIVVVDEESGRPVRISPEARAAWEPYLGEPLAMRRRPV